MACAELPDPCLPTIHALRRGLGGCHAPSPEPGWTAFFQMRKHLARPSRGWGDQTPSCSLSREAGQTA